MIGQMTTPTSQQIMDYTLGLLQQLASDWEYDGVITPTTLLFSELGLQSLDVVVLGNSMQEHYGKSIPYAELLSDIGQRSFNDVSVHEWVDYTDRFLQIHGSGAAQ